ncbi:MAG: ATPase [Magnetococcales bacterium]|nr:ATPase [Magnetococcales bacterium]
MTDSSMNPQELAQQLTDCRRQLLPLEKMAMVGQLAAGIAHEINNPVGYILSNLSSLEGYVMDLLRLVAVFREAEPLILQDPQLAARIQSMQQEIELDYLMADIPKLLEETGYGLERVRQIVKGLKDFAHQGEEQWEETDLLRCLETTLTVVWNELKYKAEVIREFQPVPRIHAISSQLNQVFSNLLINAAHAIEHSGTITVRTGHDPENESVWVEIADNGSGIAAENLERIFNPFFTTKPLGKGTGLGLSVSKQIIDKHGGVLEVTSTPEVGTTFRVSIPQANRQDGFDH